MASKHTRCGKDSARHRNGKPHRSPAAHQPQRLLRATLHAPAQAGTKPLRTASIANLDGMPRPESFVVFSAKPGARLYVGAAIHGDLDQGGQVARLVVAELLPHREREGQPGVLLLELVHSPEDFLCLVHREKDLPGPSDIHPPSGTVLSQAIVACLNVLHTGATG